MQGILRKVRGLLFQMANFKRVMNPDFQPDLSIILALVPTQGLTDQWGRMLQKMQYVKYNAVIRMEYMIVN